MRIKTMLGNPRFIAKATSDLKLGSLNSNAVVVLEDTPLKISLSQFRVSPSALNSIQAIKIMSVPAKGSFLLYTNDGSHTTVQKGDLISLNQIKAGLLQFIPSENQFGRNYANFSFQLFNGRGFSKTANMNIHVKSVYDPPQAYDSIIAVGKNKSLTLSINNFQYQSVESPVSKIKILMNNKVAFDNLQVLTKGAWVRLTKDITLTASDLLNGKLKFVGAMGTLTNSNDIQFSLFDGKTWSNKAKLNFTINDHAPDVSGVFTGAVKEDQSAGGALLTVIGKITVTDQDPGDVYLFESKVMQGKFGQLSVTANGDWIYAANNQLASLQALHAGQVEYETFQVRTTDGLVSRQITITVEGTNDAPTLTSSLLSLNDVLDNPANNPGLTIRDLISGSINDADQAISDHQPGIALFFTDNSHGVFQYSSDGGASWINVPQDLSQSSALLLPADAKLRFVPQQNFNGVSQFSVVAWDASSNQPFQRVNVEAEQRGGATAFSQNVATGQVLVQVPVHDINNPPSITIGSLSGSGAAAQWVESQGSPVLLFNNVIISTGDTDQLISQIQITVSGIRDGSLEKLSTNFGTLSLVNGVTLFSPDNLVQITTQIVGGNLRISINGDMTVSQAQNILENLQYFQTTGTSLPTEGGRSFTLSSITDNGSVDFGGINTFSPVNLTKVISVVSDPSIYSQEIKTSVNYLEQAPSIVLNGAQVLEVGAVGSLNDADVVISKNFTLGDQLTFTRIGNIVGQFDSALGILKLSGVDTVANYTAALNSVRFSSSSDNPTGLSDQRVINFRIYHEDSYTPSSESLSVIQITPVDDIYKITNLSPRIMVDAKLGPLFIDNTVYFLDVDTNDFNGSVLNIGLNPDLISNLLNSSLPINTFFGIQSSVMSNGIQFSVTSSIIDDPNYQRYINGEVFYSNQKIGDVTIVTPSLESMFYAKEYLDEIPIPYIRVEFSGDFVTTQAIEALIESVTYQNLSSVTTPTSGLDFSFVDYLGRSFNQTITVLNFNDFTPQDLHQSISENATNLSGVIPMNFDFNFFNDPSSFSLISSGSTSYGSLSLGQYGNFNYAPKLAAKSLTYGQAVVEEFMYRYTSFDATRLDSLINYRVINTDPSIPSSTVIRTVDLVPTYKKSDQFIGKFFITIVGANDAPQATSNSQSALTQDGVVNHLFSGTTFNTIESNQYLIEHVLQVSGLRDGAHEKLIINGVEVALQDGSVNLNNGSTAQVAYTNGTATVILNGQFTPESLASIVNEISYVNTAGSARHAGDRLITLMSVKDDGGVAGDGQDTTALNYTAKVSVVEDAGSIVGSANAETFILDADTLGNLLVDGGTTNASLGQGDVLRLSGDSSTLDLSFLADNVLLNIQKIDLGSEQATGHHLVMSVDDVLSISPTDSLHNLLVAGGAEDSITLKSVSGTWTKLAETQVIGNQTYVVYEGHSNDQVARVFVESGLDPHVIIS